MPKFVKNYQGPISYYSQIKNSSEQKNNFMETKVFYHQFNMQNLKLPVKKCSCSISFQDFWIIRICRRKQTCQKMFWLWPEYYKCSKHQISLKATWILTQNLIRQQIIKKGNFLNININKYFATSMQFGD